MNGLIKHVIILSRWLAFILSVQRSSDKGTVVFFYVKFLINKFDKRYLTVKIHMYNNMASIDVLADNVIDERITVQSLRRYFLNESDRNKNAMETFDEIDLSLLTKGDSLVRVVIGVIEL